MNPSDRWRALTAPPASITDADAPSTRWRTAMESQPVPPAPLSNEQRWRMLLDDRRFMELVRMQQLAAQAMRDPSAGELPRYIAGIEMLEADLLRDTGLGDVPGGLEAFRQAITAAAGFDVTAQSNRDGAALQFGLNMLTAAAGLLDPLTLPGDITRNFAANFMDAQAEREARESKATDVNIAAGGVLNPSDVVVPPGAPRYRTDVTDSIAGPRIPPAPEESSGLAKAALAVGGTIADSLIAAGRTIEDLGGTKAPVKFTETFPYIALNEESAVVMYSPSLIFGPFRAGSSPQENSMRVTGEDFAERAGWLDKCEDSDNPERCRAWTGVLTEVGTDPLLWADVARFAAFSTRAIARISGASTTSTTGAMALADQFDNVANTVYRQFTPAGAVGNVKAALSVLPFSPMSHVSDMVTRGINSVLDVRVGAAFLPRSTREAAGTMGWNASDMGGATSRLPATTVAQAELRPRLRDLLFSQGAPEWIKNPRVPSWVTGGSNVGLSPGEIAIGRENVIRTVAVRGAIEVNKALTGGLTSPQWWKMPWVRAAVPNAQVVKPEFQAYVNGMHAITRDIVDTTGTFRDWRRNPAINDRIDTLANLYGMDVAATRVRIGEAVEASRRVVLQTGYHVSGYPEFVSSMRSVTEDWINAGMFPRNVDVSDVRRGYELLRGNIDVQQAELIGAIPMARAADTGAVSGSATDPAVQRVVNFFKSNPDELKRWETEIGADLARRGREDLSGVTWVDFLDGLGNGYIRREFEGINNPQRMIESLSTRDMVITRTVNPATVIADFDAAFGAGSGDIVNDIIRVMMPATPRNMQGVGAGVPAISIRTDHVAELLSAKLGRRITNDDVANVIYGRSENVKFLQETLDLLRQNAQAGPGGTSMATPFAMTPQAFETRQALGFKDLAQLAQIDDPANILASMGARAGRQVRAQTMLTEFYDGLDAAGLIVNPSTVGLGASPRNAQIIFPFQATNGDRYVILPDNPQAWGPLANQAIPEDMARLITYSLMVDRGDRAFGQRLMNMWRRGMVSPLATAVRNMFGDIQLANQAGANMGELLGNMRRANQLRRDFARTGRLPDEFKGYEHLFNYISDTTWGQVAAPSVQVGQQGKGNTIEVALDSLMRDMVSNRTTLSRPGAGLGEQAFDHIEAFTNWATAHPAVGVLTLGGTGFLPLFRWGNEVVRTSSFLTVYDSLIRGGVKADEAVKRAAHFAVNSSFNYGATPLLPDTARRWGLSAFPQFAWFNLGRQFRNVAENPAPLARVEHARRAVNVLATEGDEGDQRGVTEAQSDWLRYSHPLTIPVRGKDGQFRPLNVEWWFPQYSSLYSVLADPFTLPAVGMVLNAGLAHLNRTGRTTLDPQFPEQIFNPGETLPVQIGQTAGWMGRQVFLPGAWRQWERFGQTLEYEANPEVFEGLEITQGRLYNLDLTSFAMGTVGIRAPSVSVLYTDPNYVRRMQEVKRTFDTRRDPLVRELNALEAKVFEQGSPNPQQVERITWLKRRITAFDNEQYELETYLRDYAFRGKKP